MVKGKMLKQHIDKKGYKRITLIKELKKETVRVHRLVCEAFIPNFENLPQVNHINGVKTDNRIANLEWVSAKSNIQHAIKENLKKYDYKNKKVLVVCDTNKRVFNSIKSASLFLGIDRNIINRRLDKEKDYKGMYFRSFIEKE